MRVATTHSRELSNTWYVFLLYRLGPDDIQNLIVSILLLTTTRLGVSFFLTCAFARLRGDEKNLMWLNTRHESLPINSGGPAAAVV